MAQSVTGARFWFGNRLGGSSSRGRSARPGSSIPASTRKSRCASKVSVMALRESCSSTAFSIPTGTLLPECAGSSSPRRGGPTSCPRSPALQSALPILESCGQDSKSIRCSRTTSCFRCSAAVDLRPPCHLWLSSRQSLPPPRRAPEFFSQEIQERARLRDQRAARREDGVNVDRGPCPLSEHLNELLLHDVGFRDGQRRREDSHAADAGAKGELEIVDDQARTNRDALLLPTGHERPLRRSPILRDRHQIVRGEVVGRLGLGAPREILRAREVAARGDAELPRDERRVIERPAPDREVESLAHDVEATLRRVENEPHV